jgi:hypothetical protein
MIEHNVANDSQIESSGSAISYQYAMPSTPPLAEEIWLG